MSKVDAQRALREARYAASTAPAGRTVQPADAAAAKAPVKAAPSKAAPAKAATKNQIDAESSSELCGHRSMNGRSCTRESGHSEKNHRYG